MFSSLQQTSHFPYETDEIQGNAYLEILASASRHWHRYRNRHANMTMNFYTVRNLPLKLKVLYIFAKRVNFNKVVTYRLETCDFFGTYFAKISCKSFPIIQKQLPCRAHARKAL